MMASTEVNPEEMKQIGHIFFYRIKFRQHSRIFGSNFLLNLIISCGFNPQIRGENDSLLLGLHKNCLVGGGGYSYITV